MSDSPYLRTATEPSATALSCVVTAASGSGLASIIICREA